MVFLNIAKIIMAAPSNFFSKVQIFLYSLPEHFSADMSKSRPAVLVDACLESKMSAIALRRPVLPEVINSSKLFGTSTSAIVSGKVVFFIENATSFAVSKNCKYYQETKVSPAWVCFMPVKKTIIKRTLILKKGCLPFNKQRKTHFLYILIG